MIGQVYAITTVTVGQMAQILSLAAYRSKDGQHKETSSNDGKSATILIFDGVWQEAIVPPSSKRKVLRKHTIATSRKHRYQPASASALT